MKKVFIVFFALLLFVGCGGSDEGKTETKEYRYEEKENRTSRSSSSTMQAREISIRTADDSQLATLKLSSEKVKILAGNNELKAKKNFSGKYKYKDSSGNTFVKIKSEIKKGEPRIRLFQGDRLLWKVKIDREGKIKIADNEENRNPYFIKLDKENKAKIKYNDRKIGFAKYKDGKVIVTDADGKELYKVKDVKRFHVAYAVLAAEDIPMKYRLIILAELLEKN